MGNATSDHADDPGDDDNPGDDAVELNIPEASDVIEQFDIWADLEDDGEEEELKGVMQQYLDAVLLRLRDESSSARREVVDAWLIRELKENGFVLRKERASLLCRKLMIQKHSWST